MSNSQCLVNHPVTSKEPRIINQVVVVIADVREWVPIHLAEITDMLDYFNKLE